MLLKIFLCALLAVISVKSDNATTLPAPQPFNPKEDAEKLFKAIDGFGTDEGAIIDVLAHRNVNQRFEIMREYNKDNKSLCDDLGGDLDGDFWNAIKALMTTKEDFYPMQVDLVTDLSDIIEVFLSFENNTIKSFAQNITLEDLLYKKDYSDLTKHIISSFFKIRRDWSSNVNQGEAVLDAKELQKFHLKGWWGTDNRNFHNIIMSRSYAHLRKVFEQYMKDTGVDIENDTMEEFSYDKNAMESYIAIIQYARDKANYFARRLAAASAGLGTTVETFTRIIVGRLEIDLAEINKAYYTLYGSTLYDVIADETSFYYKDLLLALLERVKE